MLDLDALNDAQRKAVMHGNGPLLVLAGPGSGKTFTITQRICYLLERERIAPEKILVITFTKDAAVSMQRRFYELSRQTIPVNFGTFHSVFFHILKESNMIQSGQILTEAEKRKLIFPFLKPYIPKEEWHNQDGCDEITDILSAISFYKNTGEKENAVKRLQEEWQPHFQKIFVDYEKARKQRRVFDFDDMVYECHQFLQRDKRAASYWRQRFSHILMDEFQDINPMQYEVIRLLSSDGVSLFAVGDDDQSIYGFRGSSPHCLMKFAEDYGAEQIYLNQNYRSRREIISASLHVINENKNRFVKDLQAAENRTLTSEDDTDAVRLQCFQDREQQYQYLLAKLRSKMEGEKVGILFRTNTYMQGLAVRLSREGIDFAMKDRMHSIYEHFITKDIMAYLRLAGGERQRALLLQIMNKPSRYLSREALGGTEETADFETMLQYYRGRGGDVYHVRVIQQLEQWKKQMLYLKELSPYTAVQYIRRAMGYERYLVEKARGDGERLQEWRTVLTWLCEDAAKYESVGQWRNAQEEYCQKSREKDKIQGTSEITLMTIHGSKGLEFDTVYIPDCNEKIYPHGRMPDEAVCEEERRIFYVAMTRAKNSLELLYLTGTKEHPRLPSRFLNPFFKNYSSTSSSNSQLSRYSSKASATRSYSSSSSIYPSSGSSLGSSGFSL